MREMIETAEKQERVILFIAAAAGEDADRSLDELESLAETAGAETAGRLVQNVDKINPGTYLGRGKIEELALLVRDTDADGVICDDELTSAQIGNLQDLLDTKVMDRTMLILDIFAQRARTREGSIQVELAQLRYRAVRLAGSAGRAMSRLGGGIGTRGPGEKKLETDRRLIRERISILKRELEKVKKHRELSRRQRTDSGIPVAAIVGYTNTGKSTLLNRLTDADVPGEDKLFATLDPVTRTLTLPDGQQILLTDTVGFIRKLPHHLVEAFRSTLEEAKYADLLIHVADVSSPDLAQQMDLVYETLSSLGADDKPVITVFNKIDRLEDFSGLGGFKDPKADELVFASVRTGAGEGALLGCIEKILRRRRVLARWVIPYSRAGQISRVRRRGQLIAESYEEDGIHVSVWLDSAQYQRMLAENAEYPELQNE